MGHSNKNKNKNRNKKKKRLNEQSKYGQEEKSVLVDEIETEPHLQSEFVASTGDSKKRHLNADDNDSENEEDKPRKKKKKKQTLISDTPDKKGKKSIRQMKREKFAERQATAQATAKDELKNQCLNYLSQWKHNKQNWKFMKAKQVWLYKNKFSSNLLSNSSWPLLLEYFESAQGNIRKMLLEDANKIIKQMDAWMESQNEVTEDTTEQEKDDEATPTNKKPDDIVYKRARDLIQCLEE